MGVALLNELLAEDDVDLKKPIAGNEEWKNNELEWYPTEFLESISPKQALDGVVFAKDEWEMYRTGHDSVIWQSKNGER